MDLEQLVSRLTTAILSELRQEALPTVLLFCRHDQQLPAGLADQLGSKVQLRYAEEVSPPEGIDRFVLPCLHIDQMVDMALGKGGSKMMYAVRQVLLTGSKVEVFQWQYQKYRDSAPKPLLDLYEGYRRTLHDFGLIDWIDSRQQVSRHLHAVLTEADILKARAQGVAALEIGANCRVTPLARETARNLTIDLRTATGGTA